MPALRQPLPIEFLAGIALPSRGHVGMGEHAMRRDGVAAQNVETQFLDRPHLGVGEIRIVEIVAGIVDLDADRTGIEVHLAGP